MERIRSYIESGILELYAAGDLTPAERLEVESMLGQYPELQAELSEIENSLEHYARTYAIEPSTGLRSKILDSLYDDGLRPETASAPVFRNMPVKQSSFFKYAFAASVALLLISVIALFTLYNRLQQSNEQLAVLQNSNQQFSNRVNLMEGQLTEREVALGVLRSKEYKMIKLAGTKQAPKASMMVAFNPAKKEVMIDMAAMEMPANDAEHQYQLWAMVDGKPVDLGVFDMVADDDGMKRMKAIEDAQAFAVTLEPRGGSKSPTMEQMMVIGSPDPR